MPLTLKKVFTNTVSSQMAILNSSRTAQRRKAQRRKSLKSNHLPKERVIPPQRYWTPVTLVARKVRLSLSLMKRTRLLRPSHPKRIYRSRWLILESQGNSFQRARLTNLKRREPSVSWKKPRNERKLLRPKFAPRRKKKQLFVPRFVRTRARENSWMRLARYSRRRQPPRKRLSTRKVKSGKWLTRERQLSLKKPTQTVMIKLHLLEFREQ